MGRFRSQDQPASKALNGLYAASDFSEFSSAGLGRWRDSGFRIFYYHPFDDDTQDVWRNLLSVPNLHVIHLKRRNILRALISRKIAREKKIWASVQGELSSDEKLVEFSAEELKSAFEETRGWEEEYGKLFQERPTLEMFYEDLVENPRKEFQRVTDFLELPYQEPRTLLQKQNPQRSEHLMRNFTEFKVHFQHSQWSDFFDE